jgi:hypothetical protein
LSDRDGKLAVHRLEQDEIKFSCSNELGEIDEVRVEESLEDLTNNLVRSDEQNHLPLCPVADPIDLTEDDLDKNELSNKPKRFHDHPEKKIQFEIHLPDEGVAQHHEVDGAVFMEEGVQELQEFRSQWAALREN